MKKITAWLVIFMMLLGLAGCGKSPSASSMQETDDSSAPVSSTGESSRPDEGESGESGVDIGTDTVKTGNALVVYFSATGNTKEVANYIAEATGADLFELEPKEPYTDADLDWTDENSRVSSEHDDPDVRDVELVADTVDDWASYDTVFIGYPIWWGIAAWPVDGFVKANDFTGKTVIPFCTSSSSGFGESGQLLEEMAGTGNWQEGQRFSFGASEEDVRSWIESLKLAESAKNVQISITAGKETLYAELDDSELAAGFVSLLPQTISMQRVGGGREFYGALDSSLDYNETDSQTTYEKGDVAYWYSGNGFCLFYDDEVEDTSVDSGIIVFGKLTSDLSVLHELEDNTEMIVELVE